MNRMLIVLIAAAVIFGGGVSAQTSTVSSSTLSLSTVTEAPRFLVIYGQHSKLIAKIDTQTGVLTFGEGVPVDEAAREAWHVLARNYGIGLNDIRVESCARLLFGGP